MPHSENYHMGSWLTNRLLDPSFACPDSQTIDKQAAKQSHRKRVMSSVKKAFTFGQTNSQQARPLSDLASKKSSKRKMLAAIPKRLIWWMNGAARLEKSSASPRTVDLRQIDESDFGSSFSSTLSTTHTFKYIGLSLWDRTEPGYESSELSHEPTLGTSIATFSISRRSASLHFFGHDPDAERRTMQKSRVPPIEVPAGGSREHVDVPAQAPVLPVKTSRFASFFANLQTKSVSPTKPGHDELLSSGPKHRESASNIEPAEIIDSTQRVSSRASIKVFGHSSVSTHRADDHVEGGFRTATPAPVLNAEKSLLAQFPDVKNDDESIAMNASQSRRSPYTSGAQTLDGIAKETNMNTHGNVLDELNVYDTNHSQESTWTTTPTKFSTWPNRFSPNTCRKAARGDSREEDRLWKSSIRSLSGNSGNSWVTLDPAMVLARRKHVQVNNTRGPYTQRSTSFIEFSPIPFNVHKRSPSKTPCAEDEDDSEQLHSSIAFSPSNAASYDPQAIVKEFDDTWEGKNEELHKLMDKFSCQETHVSLMPEGQRKEAILDAARQNPFAPPPSPQFDSEEHQLAFRDYQRQLTLAKLEGRLKPPAELHSPVYATSGVVRHQQVSSAVHYEPPLNEVHDEIMSPQPVRSHELIDAIHRWEAALDPDYDAEYQEERFYGLSGHMFQQALVAQATFSQYQTMSHRLLMQQEGLQEAAHGRGERDPRRTASENGCGGSSRARSVDTVMRRALSGRPLNEEILGAGEDPNDLDPDMDDWDQELYELDEVHGDFPNLDLPGRYNDMNLGWDVSGGANGRVWRGWSI